MHNNEEPTVPLWPQSVSQFFQFVRDGIIFINEHHQIIRFNDGAMEIFGYERGEVYGQPLNLLLPPRLHHRHTELMRTYFEDELAQDINAVKRGEIIGQRKDGTEFPIEASVSRFDTPNGKIAAVILRDISERKAFEDEILRQNEELDAFAHTVAHDLKNPLHHMLGFSSILQQDLDTMDVETLRRNLQYIQKAAVKANNIVNELLLLATIRKEDVQHETLDMPAIVKEAIARLSFDVQQSGAVIHVAEDIPTAIGHSAWVEEIWFNYISNAIKYGGESPTINISAQLQDSGYTRYLVADNGPGIPKEQHDHLFLSFTRLERTRAQGHGLGLSIVRRIADKLNGRVGVESQTSHGATFYFDLPNQPPVD